jgi:2-iminoacetate synthase
MIPYIKSEEADIKQRISGVTVGDVEVSLQKNRQDMNDFINLISPPAITKLAELSAVATRNKKMHFGKTIKLYTPLYISNYCINRCTYCGFNVTSDQERKRLTIDELMMEAEVIRSFGIDSILLVSGEDPNFISLDYLKKAAKKLKKLFSYLAIEIYPLTKEGYATLFDAGVDGLTLYQETYDRHTYNKMHLAGPKANYDFRLDSLRNGANAGFRSIGIGILLGIYDWRVEAVSLAAHAIWLRKHFWKSKIQFSFPRITPTAENFEVPALVSEEELEQMVLAFRIVFPESDISISTREGCEFRNRIAISAATTLSGASSVVPGGYLKSNEQDLGQFSLNDTRTVEEMDKDLRKLGLDPVYKDWDKCL